METDAYPFLKFFRIHKNSITFCYHSITFLEKAEKTMANKKTSKTKSKKTAIFLALAFIITAAGVAGIILINGQDGNANTVAAIPKDQSIEEPSQSGETAVPEGITIDKSAVTEKAAFYPYQSSDTYMEVIAVRASDGTVRTAFNTCQICFDSGRGYYEQDGDVLVCQNCGNRFTIDQIEVIKGGCNPVPIFENDKTETEEMVAISDDVMADYSTLFSKWKR